MKLGKPAAVLALAAVIGGCGSAGTLTQGQAHTTYSSIVAPVRGDLERMAQAGRDNNFPLLQQEALRARNSVQALPGQLRQHQWPGGTAKWNAPHIRVIEQRAPVISRCLGAIGQASGLLEIAAAIKGSACRQLSALSGS